MVFFSNELMQEGEKQENRIECFTLGSGKTLINCILIKSSLQSLTHKK